MDIEYGQKALQDFDKLSIDDFSFDDEQWICIIIYSIVL